MHATANLPRGDGSSQSTKVNRQISCEITFSRGARESKKKTFDNQEEKRSNSNEKYYLLGI